MGAIEKGPFAGTSFHNGRDEIFIAEKPVKGGASGSWPEKNGKRGKNRNRAHAHFVENTMLK